MPPNPSHAPEGVANSHKPSSHIAELLQQLRNLFDEATKHGFCRVAAAAYAAQQQPAHQSHRLPPSRFEMGPHVGDPPRATVLCTCVTRANHGKHGAHPLQRDRRRRYQAAPERRHHPKHAPNVADLRRDMADPSLDASAKIALARDTFMIRYKRSKTLELENNVRRLFEEQYHPLTRTGAVLSPSLSASNHAEHDDNMLGCKHYARQCKLKAKCCGLFVTCRSCHDEAMSEDHEIDRFATERVLCMLCMTEQDVQPECTKCGVDFAHYFCAECRFYDNTPGKKVYHCDRCQICRLGEGLDIDNFHCDKCDACVSLPSKPNHNCMSNALHSNCPVCRGYLFTSTEPVVFMRCGHTMHSKCFEDYTTKSYQCPLCMRSLTDMHQYFEQIDEVVRNEPMPAEFDHKRSLILCCDCQRRSTVKYHFMYHKCADPACASYNTKVIEVFDVDDHSSDDKQQQQQQQQHTQLSTDFDNTTQPEQQQNAASASTGHFRAGDHGEPSDFYSSNPPPSYPSVNV